MTFARVLQFAAFSALLAAFATPAQAQNNKPIRSGNWYEDRASGSFNGTALTITFAQSPTDKFLNVTNVACSITTSSGQVMRDVVLYVGTTAGANDLGRGYSILGNVVQRILSTQAFYNISANQILYKMGPGRYPSIGIDAPTGGSFSVTGGCVIVGNLTDN